MRHGRISKCRCRPTAMSTCLAIKPIINVMLERMITGCRLLIGPLRRREQLNISELLRQQFAYKSTAVFPLLSIHSWASNTSALLRKLCPPPPEPNLKTTRFEGDHLCTIHIDHTTYNLTLKWIVILRICLIVLAG